MSSDDPAQRAGHPDPAPREGHRDPAPCAAPLDPAPRAADLDPAVAAVLAQLAAADRETPRLAWSLARLSKRAELAMSTLRRALTALQEAGFVDVHGLDGERPTAALTAEGRAFCAAVFGAAAG